MGDCFKSTGSIVTEMRELAPFERIEVEDNVNVFLRFNGENSAQIEAGENLMELIETEVDGNTLHIRNRNTCNWVRSLKVPINITVNCTALFELIARGYGTISSLDTLEQEVFYAEQWLASGSVNLVLNTKEVFLKSHTGPADFSCSGETDFLYAYNSSYGILRLESIDAQNGYVWNTGTGDIHVHVRDSLTVQIDRQGDVYYSGNPHFLETNITGEGNAIPVGQ